MQAMEGLEILECTALEFIYLVKWELDPAVKPNAVSRAMKNSMQELENAGFIIERFRRGSKGSRIISIRRRRSRLQDIICPRCGHLCYKAVT